MERLKSFIDKYSNFVHIVAFVVLCIIVLLVNIGVFTRYFLGISYQWVDEVCRYLDIFIVLLMAAPLMWRGSHIKVDLFIAMMPERITRYVGTFNDVIMTALCTYITYYGIMWVKGTFASGMRTASSVFYVWQANLVVPVGMAAATFIGVVIVIYRIIGISSGKKISTEQSDRTGRGE